MEIGDLIIFLMKYFTSNCTLKNIRVVLIFGGSRFHLPERKPLLTMYQPRVKLLFHSWYSSWGWYSKTDHIGPKLWE